MSVVVSSAGLARMVTDTVSQFTFEFEGQDAFLVDYQDYH
jgi:plasmid maintenance system killer protein